MKPHVLFALSEPGVQPPRVDAFVKFAVDAEGRRPCSLRLPVETSDLSVANAALVGRDDRAKGRTDVVVCGSAYSGGPDVSERIISLTVGDRVKRVAAFGRRPVRWSSSGRPIFDPAEPFDEIPLDNRRAYGGTDLRVPVEPPKEPLDLLRLMAAYPGMYPRNPMGMGYVVVDEPVPVELPNLEDPTDLLSPERLIVGDPARWWRQPLPWNLGFTELAMFPRLLMPGNEPWFPAPEDESLAEVRLGILPAGYRTRVEAPSVLGVQEASVGMIFDDIETGAPIRCEGMHPEKAVVSLSLPEAPSFEFEIEGRTTRAPARLSTLVVRPGKESLELTYWASAPLPRVFIPRVHKYIPVAVTISGCDRVAYEAPPTVHDALVAAGLRRGKDPT